MNAYKILKRACTYNVCVGVIVLSNKAGHALVLFSPQPGIEYTGLHAWLLPQASMTSCVHVM